MYQPEDQSKTEFWSGVFAEIGFRVVNSDSVSQAVLDRIKAECALIKRLKDEWLSLKIVEVFQQIEKQVDEVEFRRFEESLRIDAIRFHFTS